MIYTCRRLHFSKLVRGREVMMKYGEIGQNCIVFTTLRTSCEGNGGHFRRVVSRNPSFQPCQGWCKTISSSVSVILTIRYHLSCIGWRGRNDTDDTIFRWLNLIFRLCRGGCIAMSSSAVEGRAVPRRPCRRRRPPPGRRSGRRPAAGAGRPTWPTLPLSTMLPNSPLPQQESRGWRVECSTTGFAVL